MNLSTFKRRTIGFQANSKGYQLARELLEDGGVVRTCSVSGSGRFVRVRDHTTAVRCVLIAAGLRPGFHFFVLNDAPRGGCHGFYIKLAHNGLRIIK